MQRKPGRCQGVDRLCQKYRKAFRIPENLNHYSPADFKRAERMFVKLGLTRGLELEAVR